MIEHGPSYRAWAARSGTASPQELASQREACRSDEQHPLVSIITPVFNEEGNLDDYRAAVEKTLFSREDVRVEVLFIDDGSRDDSWSILKKICGESDRYRAIRLSRNFGPHAALAAGLESVGATDAIAILACDLQDPPAVVGEFIGVGDRDRSQTGNTDTSAPGL